MGQRILEISFELLRGWFEQGGIHSPYEVIKDGLPANAKLINVRHGWPNRIELLLESESWPELSEGSLIPSISPTLRRVED